MLVTNQQTAELPEPGVGSLHDPAPFVPPELTSIFVTPFLVVAPVGRNQFNASFPQALAEGIGVVAAVGDHALRFLPGSPVPLRDRDLLERGFRKRNFCRRGTFQPNSQRNTFTVCQYHPLRSLAALGLTHRETPFLAGAKLPSRKVSSHRSSPASSNPASNARQASSQTPCSCHCCRRRQQVEGEGNSSGRNRHAAPVCKTQRIPSKQARFEAGGRPRWSRRRFRFGNRDSISSHCSSLNSFCRRFMAEAHPQPCLTHKYLARGRTYF